MTARLERRFLERVAALEGAGLRVRLCARGLDARRIGQVPPRAEVLFHESAALEAFVRGDASGLAEHYVAGRIDVEGELSEVFRGVDVGRLAGGLLHRAGLGLLGWLRNRGAWERESVAFHYDRPADFFLPWLDRLRCYSHGLFAAPDQSLDDAIARKLQIAIDALGLEPGMRVLDMGGGWGCFVEYAGLRGIRVHALTLSREQFDFVSRLIRERSLPCTIELVNFRDYAPKEPLDGAVFMGTFEHLPDYRATVAFLDTYLRPEARVWADFCAQRNDFTIGPFMKKHLWPGPTRYVDPARVVRSFVRGGFNLHELRDDTLHYAFTVRAWTRRLAAERKGLADRFGEPALRALELFLAGSEHFLTHNHSQAYHLVAGREAAGASAAREAAGAEGALLG